MWFEELTNNYMGMRFKCKKVLFSEQSPFQKVEVIETEGFGRMLINDGLVMTCERDEFCYHEMIAHVPLFTHPDPKNVLIIGGGDGGTAREVLRHAGVKKCVMVEIDEAVVRASREFIPQTSSALNGNDPRFELIIADGVKYLKECKEQFDVILVDSTDPIGPAKPLFGLNFYKDVFAALAEQGIVVAQGESYWYYKEMQESLLKVFNEVFPFVSLYNFNNLTYASGLWSFTYGSKGLNPVQDFRPERVRGSAISFNYYNEEVHKAAFVLPNFMKKNTAKYTSQI